MLDAGKLPMIASASSSIPLGIAARKTRSASCARSGGVDTMARSVSFRRSAGRIDQDDLRAVPITMPRISARVVCTLRETMVTRS